MPFDAGTTTGIIVYGRTLGFICKSVDQILFRACSFKIHFHLRNVFLINIFIDLKNIILFVDNEYIISQLIDYLNEIYNIFNEDLIEMANQNIYSND